MIPTPSPIEPTPDQADTIHRLIQFGAQRDINATVDAGPLDEVAREMCATDWAHGWATVCLPIPDRVCPGCGCDWIFWHSGEHIALDVLRRGPVIEVLAA